MQLPAALVLGSTSRYRAELLSRLRCNFAVARPEVDETPMPNEVPKALAQRLALQKCAAVQLRFPEAIVIGADQVADREGRCIGKPGDRDAAIADLVQSSGKVLIFHSAVCVRWRDLQSAFVHTTICEFRPLTRAEITAYVDAEAPLDCAGSIKSEGLGISLLRRIESDDPTGLIGLPLIQLGTLLRGLVSAAPES